MVSWRCPFNLESDSRMKKNSSGWRTRRVAWTYAILGSIVLAVVAVSRGAFAQQLPADAPQLVPPRLRSDVGVKYPEQALRDHVEGVVAVDLVLEVGTDGRVTEVAVSTTRGHGFDEAAIAAAQQLVFEPALRDGRPVAARINFRYVFTPPAAKLIGRVAELATDLPIAGARVSVRDAAQVEHTTKSGKDGRWSVPNLPPGPVSIRISAPGKGPGDASETLERGKETTVVLRLQPAAAESLGESETLEVVVVGERPPREVTKRTLGRDELQHSAGTQGDALLSVQNLPGIARPPPFSGALVVRGSAPDDTGVFIQGTQVPLIYHFGGLSSAVPTELVETIDFYPGNYSARYGRLMGGVVEVGLRAPRNDRYHLMLEGSVLGFRGLVEGPIAGGWSFYLAGQRSWLDLVLTPILEASGERQSAIPHWADYQAAIHKDFSSGSSFKLLFYGSDDAFEIVNPLPSSTDPTLGGALGLHTNFWRTQASFDAAPAPGTKLHLMASFGQDTISTSLGTTLLDATLHPLTVRAELSQTLAPGLLANFGFDLLYEPYEFALQLPAPTRPGVPSGGPGQPPIRSSGSNSLFLPAAYTELEIQPWSGARVVPGLRLDYNGTTERSDVSPRLSLRQDLRSDFPRTTLKGGIGYFTQPPTPFDTVPNLGQSGLSSNRSVHGRPTFLHRG